MDVQNRGGKLEGSLLVQKCLVFCVEGTAFIIIMCCTQLPCHLTGCWYGAGSMDDGKKL